MSDRPTNPNLADMDLLHLAQLADTGPEQRQMVSAQLLTRFQTGILAFHMDGERFRLLLANTASVIGGSFALKMVLGSSGY